MGTWHSSVSLLTLLSRGSNETDKTRVALFSFAARISPQTGQPGRSLQREKSEEGLGDKKLVREKYLQ